jgi:acetylglutamate kinase
MKVHRNARLTSKSRADLVRRVVEGQSKTEVATAFVGSGRTPGWSVPGLTLKHRRLLTITRANSPDAPAPE